MKKILFFALFLIVINSSSFGQTNYVFYGSKGYVLENVFVPLGYYMMPQSVVVNTVFNDDHEVEVLQSVERLKNSKGDLVGTKLLVEFSVYKWRTVRTGGGGRDYGTPPSREGEIETERKRYLSTMSDDRYEDQEIANGIIYYLTPSGMKEVSFELKLPKGTLNIRDVSR